MISEEARERYRKQRREYMREYSRDTRTTRSAAEKMGMHASGASRTREPDVPRGVLRERAEREQLAPRSLTAALCGDPLPGYSALERRRW